MYVASLSAADDFEGWRESARAFAGAGIAPGEITWTVADGAGDLFAQGASPRPAAGAPFSVPRPFLALAQDVILHADSERFSLLYAMLIRLRAQPEAIDDHRSEERRV